VGTPNHFELGSSWSPITSPVAWSRACLMALCPFGVFAERIQHVRFIVHNQQLQHRFARWPAGLGNITGESSGTGTPMTRVTLPASS
jgi:hypothetical protein